MTHDTLAFRSRYRAGIGRYYSGPLHAAWVLAFGISVMLWAAAQLQAVATGEWLVLVLALLVGNIGEYTIHRRLGHHKWPPARLFYQRHTGDHHSFFTETEMTWSSSRDWRVVLFPGWLIVVITLVVALPGELLLSRLFGANAGALWVLGVLATYLLYEALHFSYHLPPEHPVYRLPGLWRLRQLHALHHRREQMTEVNFNLTFPLCDWLLGTLYWEDRR